MSKPIKTICFLLVFILTVGLFSGCSGTSSDKTSNEPATTDEQEQKPAEEPSTEQPSEEFKEDESSESGTFALPIVDEPVTFTYWVPFGGTAKEIIPDLSQNEVYLELAKIDKRKNRIHSSPRRAGNRTLQSHDLFR